MEASAPPDEPWKDALARVRSQPNVVGIGQFLVSNGAAVPGAASAKTPVQFPAWRERLLTIQENRLKAQLGPELHSEMRPRADKLAQGCVILQLGGIDEITTLCGGMPPTGQFTITSAGVAKGCLGDPKNVDHILRGMAFLERSMAITVHLVFGEHEARNSDP
eukprot:CAMPEP_0183367824 /NCGR_PEP_ID=MMETSP0164_2-20130417/93770_1 /TAXON_ID=221442 /ORGANISM="Coccolithus pelagicus ssp braarudi, Strain PLY182g" /LENGTH=162 /DNA_ID=CAMNT_0025543815 /DNA_START=8 /DNA_END=492 /DNA_ORIENTATION=-